MCVLFAVYDWLKMFFAKIWFVQTWTSIVKYELRITKSNPVFKHRRLLFLHLNINSLLPKTEQLRHITKFTNAAVIRISESKLDDYVVASEIQIDMYDLLHFDRNRHGGGVSCCIRNDFSCNSKSYFPKTQKTYLLNYYYQTLNQ